MHSCRHGYASLMISPGVNVKALSVFMRHANIKNHARPVQPPAPGSRGRGLGPARRVPSPAGRSSRSGTDCSAPRGSPVTAVAHDRVSHVISRLGPSGAAGIHAHGFA